MFLPVRQNRRHRGGEHIHRRMFQSVRQNGTRRNAAAEDLCTVKNLRFCKDKSMNILVIDVGTTSMRGVLYAENGQLLGMKRMQNHVHFLENGRAEEPVSDWDENLKGIFRHILKNFPSNSIDAIAITSQRSSVIPADRDGNALADTIMWQDTRNAEICRELAEKNSEVFAITGSGINAVYSGSKMTWFRRNEPEKYKKVYKFLNIPEYIIHLMTGGFESDVTYGSRTGLMNLAGKQWDDRLLALYEVRKDQLCTLNEAGAVVGRTSAEWEAVTGCPAGIPVVSAGGDQQCGAIGQGVAGPGSLSIVTGTGAYAIAACGDIPKNLKEDVVCNASSIPGSYQLEVSSNTCANAFDWAIRTFYGMDEIDYGLIEKELSSEQEPASCLVVPYFKGTGAPDWNPDATASFSGVTLATRRSELLKAVLEGIFLEMADKIENIAAYMDINRVYVSGGMTKSEVICQLLADICGRPLYIKKDAETTAFGAFLTAMVSLGKYGNMEEAQKALNPMDEVKLFVPDERRHAVYREKMRRMKQTYEQLKEI